MTAPFEPEIIEVNLTDIVEDDKNLTLLHEFSLPECLNLTQWLGDLICRQKGTWAVAVWEINFLVAVVCLFLISVVLTIFVVAAKHFSVKPPKNQSVRFTGQSYYRPGLFRPSLRRATIEEVDEFGESFS